MKFTLGKKLGLGFGAILALMALSALLTYERAGSIKDAQDLAMNVRVPSIAVLKDLPGDLSQTQNKGRQAILAGSNPERRDPAKRGFDASWSAVDADMARLDELAVHLQVPADRDRVAAIKSQLAPLREVQEAAMQRAAGGEREALTNAGNDFADKATSLAEAIKTQAKQTQDSIGALLRQSQEDLAAQTRSMYLTVVLTTMAALAIGIFVAVSLNRNIGGSTQSVLAQAEAIAAGDLTREDLKVHSQDELGDLTMAINKMSSSLKTMILAIMESSMQVASASEQLSATSQQISANSEETSAQAKVVSSAALQVSQNLQTVATGAEERGISIRERDN